jgi:hypothetical protein
MANGAPTRLTRHFGEAVQLFGAQSVRAGAPEDAGDLLPGHAFDDARVRITTDSCPFAGDIQERRLAFRVVLGHECLLSGAGAGQTRQPRPAPEHRPGLANEAGTGTGRALMVDRLQLSG